MQLPKLNPLEQAVYDRYKTDGWNVLRYGWPDFLLVNGPDIVGVEVKGNTDRIAEKQHEMLAALSERFPILHVKQGPGFGKNSLSNGYEFHELVHCVDLADSDEMERRCKVLAEIFGRLKK